MGSRRKELPTRRISKAPAPACSEKLPLGFFVSPEPGRLRLWKLGKVAKLSARARLGSLTTRLPPAPSPLPRTGRSSAPAQEEAEAWGALAQALGD